MGRGRRSRSGSIARTAACTAPPSRLAPAAPGHVSPFARCQHPHKAPTFRTRHTQPRSAAHARGLHSLHTSPPSMLCMHDAGPDSVPLFWCPVHFFSDLHSLSISYFYTCPRERLQTAPQRPDRGSQYTIYTQYADSQPVTQLQPLTHSQRLVICVARRGRPAAGHIYSLSLVGRRDQVQDYVATHGIKSAPLCEHGVELGSLLLAGQQREEAGAI